VPARRARVALVPAPDAPVPAPLPTRVHLREALDALEDRLEETRDASGAWGTDALEELFRSEQVWPLVARVCESIDEAVAATRRRAAERGVPPSFRSLREDTLRFAYLVDTLQKTSRKLLTRSLLALDDLGKIRDRGQATRRAWEDVVAGLRSWLTREGGTFRTPLPRTLELLRLQVGAQVLPAPVTAWFLDAWNGVEASPDRYGLEDLVSATYHLVEARRLSCQALPRLFERATRLLPRPAPGLPEDQDAQLHLRILREIVDLLLPCAPLGDRAPPVALGLADRVAEHLARRLPLRSTPAERRRELAGMARRLIDDLPSPGTGDLRARFAELADALEDAGGEG